MCLRGSVAQVDFYEASSIFGSGPKDLTATFNVDDYFFEVCLTSDLSTCIQPTYRCEQLASESQEIFTGTLGNDRLISNPGTPNILIGDSGNDVLIATADEDILSGGLGDDTFFRKEG